MMICSLRHVVPRSQTINCPLLRAVCAGDGVQYYRRRQLTRTMTTTPTTTMTAAPTTTSGDSPIKATSDAKKMSDPLRILFCGSDAFSCESLRALHAERERDGSLVERLEVMVVPGKRAGRGLETIREVPCKALAETLGLKLHERKTFRGWPLPDGINLIIVVSFRLFVPKRILDSAKYGGLNIHPSLLPHLRGPAPIHHALLRGDAYTGVSLQTLDPTAFDHGAVLAQTPRPGIPITSETTTLDGLTRHLAVLGAEMLVQGLRDGLHVPPVRDVTAELSKEEDGETVAAHAPKILKADMRIEWRAWRARDLLRRSRAMAYPLWAMAVVNGNKRKGREGGRKRRVLFTALRRPSWEEAARAAVERRWMVRFAVEDEAEGWDVGMRIDFESGVCFVVDVEGDWIAIDRAKQEGGVETAAATALLPYLYRERRI